MGHEENCEQKNCKYCDFFSDLHELISMSNLEGDEVIDSLSRFLLGMVLNLSEHPDWKFADLISLVGTHAKMYIEQRKNQE